MDPKLLELIEDISIALNKYVTVAKLQLDADEETLASAGVASTNSSPPPSEKVEVTPDIPVDTLVYYLN